MITQNIINIVIVAILLIHYRATLRTLTAKRRAQPKQKPNILYYLFGKFAFSSRINFILVVVTFILFLFTNIMMLELLSFRESKLLNFLSELTSNMPKEIDIHL